MSIGAPRSGGNALTAMMPQTGGPMQAPASGNPNGVFLGASAEGQGGGGMGMDPRSVFGSFWQPQGVDYGLGGGQQPSPYIQASPYATFPMNGEGMWAGWQPRPLMAQTQGDPFSGGEGMPPGIGGLIARNPYIDMARRSAPIPLPADRMPRTGGPMQGSRGGLGADQLNALVLAALAGRPAQSGNGADGNIRRFMGIG